MDNRIWSSGASGTPPLPPASPSSGYPSAGDPALNIEPTKGGAFWFHQIGEELRNVLIAAGVIPDETNLSQVADAIQILINTGRVGSVQYFAMSTAPTGWLKANGALISRATYANLFAAIGTTYGAGDGVTTFALPDLRGEFLRSWDDARGIDVGRVFGSAQTDSMQGHRHQFNVATWQAAGGTLYPGIGGYTGDSISGSPTSAVAGAVTDGINGVPRTGIETRPRNVALLACIKY